MHKEEIRNTSNICEDLRKNRVILSGSRASTQSVLISTRLIGFSSHAFNGSGVMLDQVRRLRGPFKTRNAKQTRECDADERKVYWFGYDDGVVDRQAIAPGIADGRTETRSQHDRIPTLCGGAGNGSAQDIIDVKVDRRVVGKSFDREFVPAGRAAGRAGCVEIEPASVTTEGYSGLVFGTIVGFPGQRDGIIFSNGEELSKGSACRSAAA